MSLCLSTNIKRILIFDTSGRWEAALSPLWNALVEALNGEIKVRVASYESNAFIDVPMDTDVVLLHTSDIEKVNLDLKNEHGPIVIKYSGGAASEATGENRERVFALEVRIEDDIFTKAETWKAILKYISDPKNQSKPACMGLSVQYIFLRSQILTPFVALHLALQDYFDGKDEVKKAPLIFECKECCENIKQELPEQFQDANGTYDDLKIKVGELCQIIKKEKIEDEVKFKKLYEELCTAGKSGSGLIGDFAEMLEGVINKVEFKKKIITLRHNIKNLLGTIDPNINALKNADKQAVREEWSIAKEAILRSGIDRVEKEIKLYDEIRGTIRKGNDIYEKLMEADKVYKVLFKAFSSNIEGDSIDNILKSGEALIQILKDIIKKLEEMENA